MSNAILFAQAGAAGGIIHWVIVAVIICGIIGVAYIGIRQSGVAIPAFVFQIFWIVVVVVLVVTAITFMAQYL